MQDLQTTIFIAVVIAFVAMIVAGVKNKIVIYFDVNDLLISFAPWVSLFFGVFIANGYENKIIGEGIAIIGVVSALFFLVWSMKLSITYNKSIGLGLFVGIFKILSSLLAIIIFIGQLRKIFGNRSAFGAVVILGFFAWLGKKLINGEQVYINKGWEMPKLKNNAKIS